MALVYERTPRVKQDSKLARRVVTLINQYPQPMDIFHLITKKQWDYAIFSQERLGCRDRAMMAMAFACAGRVTEVVGGPHFASKKVGSIREVELIGRHLGLTVENLRLSAQYILVNGMKVVKRSRKLLLKYGPSIAFRDDFVIPLECGLFSNPFWDQLVPFGWLFNEYLLRFAPKSGKLFGYEDTRAWQIIDVVTGMFPNWFRAQGEHFYGHYLLSDSIKLSKFVNIQDPKHVKHYIGYSWNEQLKDTAQTMNFDWIAPAVEAIKNRIAEKTK